jgi:hypothetical protein
MPAMNRYRPMITIKKAIKATSQYRIEYEWALKPLIISFTIVIVISSGAIHAYLENSLHFIVFIAPFKFN